MHLEIQGFIAASYPQIQFAYFCPLVATAVLSELYFRHKQWGWSQRKKNENTVYPQSEEEKKAKMTKRTTNFPFCWDWTMLGYLAPCILPSLSASLPGLGELEHDEKSYSSVIWLEDKEERSLKKVSSQGAHNWEAFQLPNCKSLTLPVSTASATGRAAGTQPLNSAEKGGTEQG